MNSHTYTCNVYHDLKIRRLKIEGLKYFQKEIIWGWQKKKNLTMNGDS